MPCSRCFQSVVLVQLSCYHSTESDRVRHVSRSRIKCRFHYSHRNLKKTETIKLEERIAFGIHRRYSLWLFMQSNIIKILPRLTLNKADDYTNSEEKRKFFWLPDKNAFAAVECQNIWSTLFICFQSIQIIILSKSLFSWPSFTKYSYPVPPPTFNVTVGIDAYNFVVPIEMFVCLSNPRRDTIDRLVNIIASNRTRSYTEKENDSDRTNMRYDVLFNLRAWRVAIMWWQNC